MKTSFKNFSNKSFRYLIKGADGESQGEIGFSIDYSRVNLYSDFVEKNSAMLAKALEQMEELESGAVANSDEGRMVGHYWLRSPSLAPSGDIEKCIREDLNRVEEFVKKINTGVVKSGSGRKFRQILLIGIGGSALGPQLVYDCLRSKATKLDLHFFDNTDPDGFELVLSDIDKSSNCGLEETLVLVISKSGGTKETRNGMLTAKFAFEQKGINFEKNAVAITGVGSDLDNLAKSEGWLASFPMYDWVGGRTSVMSCVGLLPMALLGFDIRAFLSGASRMDGLSRSSDVLKNPSLLMALIWYIVGKGRGAKDMVVIPYKDKLSLFGSYLQQLVMESLGKAEDLAGVKVEQGLSVFGNKGSTDQHAYVQQLRDGLNNFFVVFIEVLESGSSFSDLKVESDFTSGDFLQGFLRGTRSALSENGRENVTITVDRINEFSLGMLIALFERSVGFYANFVNINAYHQPGVEAGKKAAGEFLELLSKVRGELEKCGGRLLTEKLADRLGSDCEEVYHCLNYLAKNCDNVFCEFGEEPSKDYFWFA